MKILNIYICIVFLKHLLQQFLISKFVNILLEIFYEIIVSIPWKLFNDFFCVTKMYEEKVLNEIMNLKTKKLFNELTNFLRRKTLFFLVI